MTRFLTTLAAAGLLAGPLAAQESPSGDAEAGEQAFRQCQACHVVTDDEGNTIAGRGSQVGPNLYGVAGRQAGSLDFRYGDDLAAAGEQGLEWTEENFVAYVQDPTGFLREYLGDDSARGRMAFQVRDEQDAHDLYAFLASAGSDGGADSGGGEDAGSEEDSGGDAEGDGGGEAGDSDN